MSVFLKSWPFLEPVSREEVVDYYDLIQDPIGFCNFDKKEYKFGDRYQNHRKETPFKSLHGQREIHKRCEKDFHKREILQSTRNDLF